MKLSDITLQQALGGLTAIVGALLAFFVAQENSGDDIDDTVMLVLGALAAMLGATSAFFGGTVNMARTVLAKRGDVRVTTAAKK